MAKAVKAFCTHCDGKMQAGESFCPTCGRPTSWATHDERVAWEVEEWRRIRAASRPATVHAPSPPPPRRRVAAESVAAAPALRADLAEEAAFTEPIYRPPALPPRPPVERPRINLRPVPAPEPTTRPKPAEPRVQPVPEEPRPLPRREEPRFQPRREEPGFQPRREEPRFQPRREEPRTQPKPAEPIAAPDRVPGTREPEPTPAATVEPAAAARDAAAAAQSGPARGPAAPVEPVPHRTPVESAPPIPSEPAKQAPGLRTIGADAPGAPLGPEELLAEVVVLLRELNGRVASIEERIASIDGRRRRSPLTVLKRLLERLRVQEK